MVLVVGGVVVMLVQFVTRSSMAAWLTLMITSVLFTGAMMLLKAAGVGGGHQPSESGLIAAQWVGLAIFLIAGTRRLVSRFTRWRGSRGV